MEWMSVVGLESFVTSERIVIVLRALLTALVGLVLARLTSAGIVKLLGRQATAQERMLLRRLAFYAVLALVGLSVLGQLGVNLSVLLGAAGILTVALGFASQTSASNLISGLFLIAERPFVVGDVIKIDDMVGEVLSVDLLSIKIRAFDNTLIRLPNESIIKSRFTNLTHFPIRRVDLKLGVAYKEDVARVEEVLIEVADRNPLSLDQPRPQFFFTSFGESALELQFSVWVRKDNFTALKNSMLREIKVAFDAAGIEIPFPHVTLYTGSVTEPFPLRLAGDRAQTPPEAGDGERRP